MKCPNCGADFQNDGRPCRYCGTHQAAQPGAPSQREMDDAALFQKLEASYHLVFSDKNKWMTLFLCFFFGFSGAHKFYVGRVMGGIIYLLTFGLFGFGWAFDLILILFNRFTDQNGRRLVGRAAASRIAASRIARVHR